MITMKQLKAYCAKYDVSVEVTRSHPAEIELIAPAGKCFEPDLHCLLSSTWDDQPFSEVIQNAFDDAKAYCPLLESCPDDCDCHE